MSQRLRLDLLTIIYLVVSKWSSYSASVSLPTIQNATSTSQNSTLSLRLVYRPHLIVRSVLVNLRPTVNT